MKYLLLLFMLVSSAVYAEDIATYSGSTVTGCQSIGDSRVFLNNPNDYSTIKAGYVYIPSGCKNFPAPLKYLKQSNGEIVEMSQAEKDAVDQVEAQALLDAESARILAIDDTLVATQTVRVTKAEQAIDNINNLADAKVFLKRLVRYLASQKGAV